MLKDFSKKGEFNDYTNVIFKSLGLFIIHMTF